MKDPQHPRNLPLCELQIMHDQLILGEGTHDIDYIYHVLNSEVNVENYIRLSTQSSNAIGLLFKCLKLLNENEHAHNVVSNVLRLIYSYCSSQLNQDTKDFIVHYTGLNDLELRNTAQSTDPILYYSDGIKRQKLEARQNNENKDQSYQPEVFFTKKHQLDDGADTSRAKRQRLKSASHSFKRDVPLEDHMAVENASKRKRIFNEC